MVTVNLLVILRNKLISENAKWDRVQMVSIIGNETSYHMKEFWKCWNISVHLWLKHYVFLRVVTREKKFSMKPILATFVASAIWHGFYSGYFVKLNS